MKIVEGFKLRPLGREFIIVGEGIAQVNFNKMISLNETAAYLWESLIGKEFSVEDMTRILLDRYDVDDQTAAKDAARLAQDWIETGLVTE